MAKIRAPRLRGLFSKATGRHHKANAKPADEPRLRTQRAGTARAELARRADKREPRAYGQRVTPLNDRPDPYGTRTWSPPRFRGTARAPVSTREQLAKRGGDIRPHPASGANARTLRTAPRHAVPTRAQLAQRGGDIRPHPDSGAGARSHVKAKGTARRQAAPLPGDALPAQRKRARKQTARVVPAPVPEQRRSPLGYGNHTGTHGFVAPPRPGQRG